MLIEQLIQDLLASHDCVIVPGLGGFVVQREAAAMLSDRMLPPRATVGFNPELQQTDGLLASALKDAEGMTYRDASEQVAQWVGVLKQHIKDGQAATIAQVGTLRAAKAGRLEFTPGEASFLPDNYGLEPLWLHPLATEEHKNLAASAHNSAGKQPAHPVTHWRAAAILLVILGMWGISHLNQPVIPVDTASFSPLDWSGMLLEQQRVADSIAADSISRLCQSEQPMRYHLIVASLDLAAAETYCQRLIDEGHACAHVLNPRAGNYPIAIESYPTLRDAVDSMRSLRTQSPTYRRAWVLTQ